VLVLAAFAVLEPRPAAAACPSCATGRQARSEVWKDDFGANLLVAVFPFLVIGGICLRAETIGRPARPRPPGAASARTFASRSHEPPP
jgi:hypothetical protein